LARLDVEIIDFICNVFAEDKAKEAVFVQGLPVIPEPQHTYRRLTRRSRHGNGVASKQQWNTFNQQSLFGVLSSPCALIASFTQDEVLMDSQTLWYCMLRLISHEPELVFHSLWLAIERLPTPPADDNRRRTSRPESSPEVQEESLKVTEGYIVSICLHALVAAASLVSDPKTMHEIAQLRSRGLVLAPGATSRHASSTCLDYDNIFSHELALRLARRVFSAIGASRKRAGCAGPLAGTDILHPLISQLSSGVNVPSGKLEFTESERRSHQIRMPALLLEWARGVLLQTWDGNAEFASDGPFGGAMSFVSSICQF
jgi:hypothetical protein